MYVHFKFDNLLNKDFIKETILNKFPDANISFRRYGSRFGTYGVFITNKEGLYDFCLGLSSKVSYVKTIPNNSLWVLDSNNIYKDVIDEKKCFKNEKNKK